MENEGTLASCLKAQGDLTTTGRMLARRRYMQTTRIDSFPSWESAFPKGRDRLQEREEKRRKRPTRAPANCQIVLSNLVGKCTKEQRRKSRDLEGSTRKKKDRESYHLESFKETHG